MIDRKINESFEKTSNLLKHLEKTNRHLRAQTQKLHTNLLKLNHRCRCVDNLVKYKLAVVAE